MDCNWEILDVDSKDGVITSAQYQVTATDGELSVKTQGHWAFKQIDVKIDFDKVTRNDIIGWVKNDSFQDGVNVITSNLEKQLETLKSQAEKKMPWDNAVFKPFA
jgi:VCBS repeat-containing protein